MEQGLSLGDIQSLAAIEERSIIRGANLLSEYSETVVDKGVEAWSERTNRAVKKRREK